MLGRNFLLHFQDLKILLLSLLSLQSLPIEFSFQKIHQDIRESLHVVSSGLLQANVSVYRDISSSARKPFSLSVSNVLFLGVHVFLSQSKINQENSSVFFSSTGHYVVWLYVSVNDSVPMNELDDFQHLYSDLKSCL